MLNWYIYHKLRAYLHPTRRRTTAITVLRAPNCYNPESPHLNGHLDSIVNNSKSVEPAELNRVLSSLRQRIPGLCYVSHEPPLVRKPLVDGRFRDLFPALL